MADYITLLGAEQVQSAANTMSAAADKIRSAVYNMECSFESNQRFMENWLIRFEAACTKSSI